MLGSVLLAKGQGSSVHFFFLEKARETDSVRVLGLLPAFCVLSILWSCIDKEVFRVGLMIKASS